VCRSVTQPRLNALNCNRLIDANRVSAEADDSRSICSRLQDRLKNAVETDERILRCAGQETKLLGQCGVDLLPPLVPIDRRPRSPRFWIGAALAVQDDHAINDVPTMDASHGKDSGASFTDYLWHSQAGTTGTRHVSLLGYRVVNGGDPQAVSCNRIGIACGEAQWRHSSLG
jgi:hypothetical protein